MRTSPLTLMLLRDELDRPTAWPEPTVPVARTALRDLLLDLADLSLRVTELEVRLASASSPSSAG